jgi:hypothetical protein
VGVIALWGRDGNVLVDIYLMSIDMSALVGLRPEYRRVKIGVLKSKELLIEDSLSFNPNDIKHMT